jgi:hypothetical protein
MGKLLTGSVWWPSLLISIDRAGDKKAPITFTAIRAFYLV